MQRSGILERLGLKESEYALLTVHRASNTDDPENLRAILRAISASGIRTVFPVHPRTRNVLASTDAGRCAGPNVMMIPPLGYVEALRLIQGARVLVTDSGGMQKEAFMLGTRCITLRDTTEWPETRTGNMNVLVGADEEKILAALSMEPGKKTRSTPFGRPGAAERIGNVLEQWSRTAERS